MRGTDQPASHGLPAPGIVYRVFTLFIYLPSSGIFEKEKKDCMLPMELCTLQEKPEFLDCWCDPESS